MHLSFASRSVFFMHNVYACRYADLRARAQLTVEDARSGLPFVTGSQRPAPSRAPAPSSRRPLAPGHARRALRVGNPRRRSEPVMRVGRGGGVQQQKENPWRLPVLDRPRAPMRLGTRYPRAPALLGLARGGRPTLAEPLALQPARES